MSTDAKKVLMLGWEFPPVFSGGLGVVTQNLAQALQSENVDLTLVLPQFITEQIIEARFDPGVKLMTFADSECDLKALNQHKKTWRVKTLIHSPYLNPAEYETQREKFLSQRYKRRLKSDKSPSQMKKGPVYGENLFAEIDRFAAEVLALSEGEHFDVVHAHDWITAEAALQLKLQRGLPYILHVHATEVDRTGNHQPDSEVFRRERFAMKMADKIIAVSRYTKDILVSTYEIDGNKIEVVYNAYEARNQKSEAEKNAVWQKDKSQFWVLFIGRVTLQKGPEYFVETAKLVVENNPKQNIHFFIAGTGDMLPQIQDMIYRYGLNDRVHCLGFLNAIERDSLYMLTDACIIPSVSEPFGLTAVEVIEHHTPLIISKNCGANELLGHKFPVDFWDAPKMAEYVLALERYPHLRRTIRHKAIEQGQPISWQKQAEEVVEIYNKF